MDIAKMNPKEGETYLWSQPCKLYDGDKNPEGMFTITDMRIYFEEIDHLYGEFPRGWVIVWEYPKTKVTEVKLTWSIYSLKKLVRLSVGDFVYYIDFKNMDNKDGYDNISDNL